MLRIAKDLARRPSNTRGALKNAHWEIRATPIHRLYPSIASNVSSHYQFTISRKICTQHLSTRFTMFTSFSLPPSTGCDAVQRSFSMLILCRTYRRLCWNHATRGAGRRGENFHWWIETVSFQQWNQCSISVPCITGRGLQKWSENHVEPRSKVCNYSHGTPLHTPHSKTVGWLNIVDLWDGDSIV